jgi:hypothetical protein
MSPFPVVVQWLASAVPLASHLGFLFRDCPTCVLVPLWKAWRPTSLAMPFWSFAFSPNQKIKGAALNRASYRAMLL